MVSVCLVAGREGVHPMREVRGDLWDFPAEYRVITVNPIINKHNLLVMGRGVALQAAQRFPWLRATLAGYVRKWGNRVFILHHEKLITFPVKHHWREQADPVLIRRSAVQLVEVADKFQLRNVALPRPGCSNGRLLWEDVRPLLLDVLDDRFTVVDLAQ